MMYEPMAHEVATHLTDTGAMRFEIFYALTMLVMVVGIPVGLIILQVYLSKKESKWPGLVMPIISFCMSLVVIFSMVAYNSVQSTVREIAVVDTQVLHSERLDELRARAAASPEEAQRIAEMEALTQERMETMQYHGRLIEYHSPSSGAVIGRIVIMFLMLNIPTIIGLVIYASYRGRRRQNRAVEMMSLQDLG